MVLSEILTVGDELLRGDIVDTNSAWLAKELVENEIKIRKITTVGDKESQIAGEIKRAVKENVDFLIITGGLGPTPDDRTLRALSLALERKQEFNEKALEMVKKRYSELAKEGKTKNGKLTPARKKMANLPIGTEPIFNPSGTAPAILAEERDTKIICLPGIPKEMKAIFKENPNLFKLTKSREKEHFQILEIIGRGESSLAPLYERVEEKFPNAKVSSYPSVKGEEVEVKVRLSGQSEKHVSEIEKYFRKLIKNLEQAKIKNRLKDTC